MSRCKTHLNWLSNDKPAHYTTHTCRFPWVDKLCRKRDLNVQHQRSLDSISILYFDPFVRLNHTFKKRQFNDSQDGFWSFMIKAQFADGGGDEDHWNLTQQLPQPVGIWNPVLIVRGFTVSPAPLPLGSPRYRPTDELREGFQRQQ